MSQIITANKEDKTTIKTTAFQTAFADGKMLSVWVILFQLLNQNLSDFIQMKFSDGKIVVLTLVKLIYEQPIRGVFFK
jgi:hypothetical protein